MYFFEQLLYEQQNINPNINQQQTQAPVKNTTKQQPPPVQQAQPQKDFEFSEDDLEQGDGDDIEGTEDSSSSLIPIKRYYLIQKLFALNNKLNELRIKNDILNLVITFIDSFTYESLLSISEKLTEEIYLQVKSNNPKKLESK